MTDAELKQAVKRGTQLKRGDNAILLHGGGDNGLHGFADGMIVRVEDTDYQWGRPRHSRVEIARMHDGYKGYALLEQLERVDHE